MHTCIRSQIDTDHTYTTPNFCDVYCVCQDSIANSNTFSIDAFIADAVARTINSVRLKSYDLLDWITSAKLIGTAPMFLALASL